MMNKAIYPIQGIKELEGYAGIFETNLSTFKIILTNKPYQLSIN